MSAEYSFDEAAALRHVARAANVDQLRAAVLAIVDGADAGGFVYDEVRDLKHLLWSNLTGTASAEEAPAQPEVRAVTGTYHQAGTVRTGPVGRRAVGFQLDHTTTEGDTE